MFRNASRGVIRVSGKNPHYFEYRGKEILLITSAEHYGAVISRNFDYIKYFDMLSEYGLNYTRIYPGAIVEPEGMWLAEDTMSPGPNLIVPWARSDVPGYIGGGCKFDLNKWDPDYFIRLGDFLTEADKRNIIVEICFFNCQNIKYWEHSPLYKDANIQGIGDCDHITFQTLDNEPLVSEQLKYIEKIIVETNSFDNLIYEFVDEPTLMLTNSHKAYHWIEKQIDLAISVEEKLPKKHMLTQQLELGVDFCDDQRTAFIVTQYLELNSRQVGGIAGLNNCYCYNKPIELNETAYIPSWYDRDHTAVSRLEAWEFMVGGGASFNQLNGYFIPSNPSGENKINRSILAGLKNLRKFMESLDYIKMTRDNETIQKSSIGARINMISEKGRQYAIYMHHCHTNYGNYFNTFYEPEYGEYQTVLTVLLEKGIYTAAFMEPETLKVLKEIDIAGTGAELDLECPLYTLDIVIKIVAKASGGKS